MEILVIGGVAAGTKVAAKVKREIPDAKVTILTKDADISYAGCGLPYYLGGVIAEKEALVVNTPEAYQRLTGVEVHTKTEVRRLIPESKAVEAVQLDSGLSCQYSYDKLVLATGASSIRPPIAGIELSGVFCMRTIADAEAAKAYVASHGVRRVVVAGGGFIGLEVAENLRRLSLRVTVIDLAPQILPGFSFDFAAYAADHLEQEGIKVMTNTRLLALEGDGHVERVITDGKALKADLVILSLGIRPNTDFLAGSGLVLHENHTIQVDRYFQTNLPDIYAVGDCISVRNRLTNLPQWSPMGSSANLEGRICAQNLAGKHIAYPGVLGTTVCHLPALNVGKTGLADEAAKHAGFDPVSVTLATDDKAHYYPGADTFLLSLTVDRASRRLLGLQVMGSGAVDKVVDIGVMALSAQMTLEQLDALDLAYAPPFSTAIHPFVTAVQVLENKLDGRLESITPAEYRSGAASDYRIVDASKTPSIPGALYLSPTDAQDGSIPLQPNDHLLLICTKGKQAYLLQNKLRSYGFQFTKVLEGGLTFQAVMVE